MNEIIDFIAVAIFGISIGLNLEEKLLKSDYHLVRRKRDKQEDGVLGDRLKKIETEMFDFEKDK